MESHKSIHIQKRLESSLHKSPVSSSPLRKKSGIQKQPSNILSENDDEAERIARRREIYTPTTAPPGSNRRHSLGLGFLANVPVPQMAESINQCIKLSAENKISIKNAFSLEMIDFMTYMIKKQDNNMSNLQVASTSLDVSSKIYGFRVDSVYTEILKIIGGLDKQVTENVQDEEKEEEVLQENADTYPEVLKKKKKKKSRQNVCSTIEALRGNIEIIKPLSMMIGEGDLQTSDMLYQAILPNHANSGFYQHLYNDVLVDDVEPESPVNSTEYDISTIEDFQNLEICASYSNFKFLGWSVENEPGKISDTSMTEHNDDQTDNRFQFDLDATVEHEDENSPPDLINYFDIETQDDKLVYECHQRQVTTNQTENLVDTPAATTAESSKFIITPEYSFVLPSTSLHWAGPAHWKFHNFSKPPVNTVIDDKVVGACMQAPLRKKKEISLSYEENKDVTESKFTLSQSNKLQAKTAKTEWNAEKLTLPEDIHYDITLASKLYLQNLGIKSKDSDKDDAIDVSDNGRYDYNNPNDTADYCPDVHNGDYDEGRDNNDENECNFEFEDDNNALATQGFTGDNLIAAPKLANKISIAYCLKAKRIDMRQLKKSIWKCLKSTDSEDNTHIAEAVEQTESDTMKEPKLFNDVYKMVPKLLTKNNVEALSVPLFFISLLHLTNEKTLSLCSFPDMSDITVEKD
ncbi:Condensin complex subunit 2 [Harpegnathos saltator]|uniref:Condensin complex subunit 2 n=1 Tax=Harpegnathos saltator TaxID=610380 RepID=E2BKT3_HARSA|nr:Condensin complex subunit 2 [Harpegnathos saltator]